MIFFLPKSKLRKYPKPKGQGFCKSGLERESENLNRCCCVFVGCVAVFSGLCCCVLVVGIFFGLHCCCVFCCSLQGTRVLMTRFPYESVELDSLILDLLHTRDVSFLNSLETLLAKQFENKYYFEEKKSHGTEQRVQILPCQLNTTKIPIITPFESAIVTPYKRKQNHKTQKLPSPNKPFFFKPKWPNGHKISTIQLVVLNSKLYFLLASRV